MHIYLEHSFEQMHFYCFIEIMQIYVNTLLKSHYFFYFKTYNKVCIFKLIDLYFMKINVSRSSFYSMLSDRLNMFFIKISMLLGSIENVMVDIYFKGGKLFHFIFQS